MPLGGKPREPVRTRLEVGRTKAYDLIRTHRLLSLRVDGCRRIPDDAVRDFIRRGIGRPPDGAVLCPSVAPSAD
ncbi:hypothetical protein ACFU6S_36210 [Streptomyces sp. NPDC057456]|uniref:hypothetical protein n=1 Tax=Streptomyces sp. NPDC057456 TaxID=3346139 RepID=UPI003695CCF2